MVCETCLYSEHCYGEPCIAAPGYKEVMTVQLLEASGASKEFVDKYIDKIFVTLEKDGTMRLQIKIFTGETTDKYLSKLRGRTGHTSKKMIESYEKSL